MIAHSEVPYNDHANKLAKNVSMINSLFYDLNAPKNITYFIIITSLLIFYQDTFSKTPLDLFNSLTLLTNHTSSNMINNIFIRLPYVLYLMTINTYLQPFYKFHI